MPPLPEQHRLSPNERANLVAYLDGELTEADAQAIATKLTHSVTARRELEALEKTWELLDYLPRPQPSFDFTQRTLTQIEVLETRGGRVFRLADAAFRRLVPAAVLLLSSLCTLGVAYAATRWIWPDPTARLERELSLAEHLDEYLDVGSFGFLTRIDESPLFGDDLSLLQLLEPAWTPEANQRRLSAMPREERLLLAKNLVRFDNLTSTQQAAAREVDDQLAHLPIEERTRLLAELRMYHLWLAALPEAKRQELAGAALDQRLALVSTYREADANGPGPQPEARRAELVLLAGLPLYELGGMLRVWFALTPQDKAALQKVPRDQLKKQLRERAFALGIRVPKRPLVTGKMQPRVQQRIEKLKVQKKEQVIRRLEEAHWLMDHEPPKVDGRKLVAFEAALPPWVRPTFDALPPELARRRLAVLYRLVFPEGTEMPEPPPAQPKAAHTPAPPPRPAAPPAGGNSVPF